MAATYEEILNLFRETDRKFQETDRKFQETDRQFKEMREVLQSSSLETGRMFQESERMLQESERMLQESERIFQESERKFQETNMQSDRRMAQLSKQIGAIGNSLGLFVEDMVKPAVVGLFRERGLDVHSVIQRYAEDRHGEAFEVDLLVINDGDAIAVECKTRPSSTDVQEHLERLEKVRRISPIVQNKRLMGAIAGMGIDKSVKTLAQNKGLYVLVQNGEQINIEIPADFTPTYW